MPTPPLTPSPAFQCEMPARLESIAPMLQALEAWAEGRGVPAGALARVGLMLDELMTNVVIHGYRGAAGRMALEAGVANGSLHLTLIDFAFAYDPLQAPAPDTTLDMDSREIGGLGVHFVRRMADAVRYERTRHRGREANELHIVKRF